MTKTSIGGALVGLRKWEKSADDLPPAGLEPAYLRWLVKQLAKERNEALRKLSSIRNLTE